MTSSDLKTCTTCGKVFELCQCGTKKIVIDEATADAIQAISFDKKKNSPLAERRVSKYELLPNDELESRYRILNKIGKGGTGVVYKAEHVVLGKHVAIKVLNTELISDTTAISRFEQEARACAALCHKNLVSVTDCGVTLASQPYLVMEFLEGDDLMEILRKARFLTEKRFLEIFIDVCTGLAYAHSYGVIHRDLKPSNIILTITPEGSLCPKIVDFGMAKIEEYGGQIQMLTSSGEVFGSPSYMSPEQCQGTRVDTRSDVYSLGCVMYEALMGRRAFPGDNIMAIVNMHMEQEPPALIANRDGGPISPEIAAIVLKCMRKDPDERFQTMEALKEQLVSRQTREGRLVHLGKYRVPSNILTSGLILLVVAGVATGTFLLQSRLSGEKEAQMAAESERERARLSRLVRISFLEGSGLKERYRSELTSMAKSKELSLEEKSGIVLLLVKHLNDADDFEGVINVFEKKLRSFFEQLIAHAKSEPASLKEAASSAPLIFYYVGRAYEHRKADATASRKRQEYQYKSYQNNSRQAFQTGADIADRLDSSDWVKGKAYAEYGESLYEQEPVEIQASLKYLNRAIALYKKEPDAEIKAARFDDLQDGYKDAAAAAKKGRQIEVAAEYLTTLVGMLEAREDYAQAKRFCQDLSKLYADAHDQRLADKWQAKSMSYPAKSSQSSRPIQPSRPSQPANPAAATNPKNVTNASPD